MNSINLDYEFISKHGTGGDSIGEQTITVIYPFGRYEVKVVIRRDGRFVGIEEIRVNKEFLDNLQKMEVLGNIGYQDVEQYYKEEEE